MLRIVTKMSMSFCVLDTHRTSFTGPVTSVSSASGSVWNETPVRFIGPADVIVEEAEATPAFVVPVAEYVTVFSVAGGLSPRPPSTPIGSESGSERSARR